VNIDPLNPGHWKILITSAVFLSLAVLVGGRKRNSTGNPRVVFYSAVERPTVTRLLDQLLSDDAIDWDIVHCSFEEKVEQEGERYGTRLRRIKPCTWAGAKEIVSADVIVTSDRLRTLGIVLHGTTIPFVDVWHGISFKHIKRPKFLRHYEEVWVSSDYIAELYRRKLKVPKKILKVTGFSPSDPLQQTTRETKKDGDSPRVLIAPTWSPQKLMKGAKAETRFWEDFSYMSSLAAELGIRFIMRSHFLDRGEINRADDTPGLSFVPQTVLSDPSSLLAEADVLVTDWSSLAFEFLPTTRPTLFIENTDNRPKKFLVTPDERWGPVVSRREEFRKALINTLSTHSAGRQDSKATILSALHKFHRQSGESLSAAIQAERLRKMLSRR
jgi:hypothetical protein